MDGHGKVHSSGSKSLNNDCRPSLKSSYLSWIQDLRTNTIRRGEVA